MRPANSISEIENGDETIKACIYTPNSDAIKPLREYLESAGIITYLNDFDIPILTYAIVAGPSDFVKQFFASHKIATDKLLIIVWGRLPEEPEVNRRENTKKIYLDDEDLIAKHIKEIFSFFFISADYSLDLRTPQALQTQVPAAKPEIEVKATEVELSQPKQIPLSRADAILSQDFSGVTNAADKKRISDTIAEMYGDIKTETPKKHQVRLRHKTSFVKGIIFLVCLCLAPSIWYGICLGLSGTTLFISAINLEKGNTNISKSMADMSGYWQTQAGETLTIAKIPAGLVFRQRIFLTQEQILSFMNDATGAITAANTLANSGGDFIKFMTGQLYGSAGQTQTTATLVDELKTQLPYIHDRLGLASAQLKYLISVNAFPVSLPPIRQRSAELLAKLDNSRMEVDFLENLLTLYAAAAGFDSGKTYLVLLQNGTELRPTGGFIGSLALASVHDGFISDLKVEDVYTDDGQLKGHADPPKPIREILGQEHWYLRDSNWDPDFTQSGKTAAWFYQKETNVAVDGVIAVSSPFLVDILKATGPINLTDYHDQITADNFYGKSLYYIQTGFFPGSTQKKDFLGTLLNAIVLKITDDKSLNQVLFMKSLESALTSHDVMMYFNKPQLEQLTEQFGWAGSGIAAKSCESIISPRICAGDFIGTVEANLSVSKINYFISRDKMTRVDIGEDGSVTDTIAIEFTNSSEDKNGQGGGVYRNYERFYIPADAQISQIMVSGQNVPVRNPTSHEAGIIPYAEYETPVASNTATILGVAFDVKPKEKVNLVLSYKHNMAKPLPDQPVVYELLQPLQPGIGSSSGKTVIRLPSTWIYNTDTIPGKTTLLANMTQLEYNTVTDADDIIRITVQANKGE